VVPEKRIQLVLKHLLVLVLLALQEKNLALAIVKIVL